MDLKEQGIFEQRSENMKKPFLSKESFVDDVNELTNLLLKSLKKLVNEDYPEYGIWIEGVNRNELRKHLKNALNEYSYGGLIEFCTTFFEGTQFGIVAQNANSYDKDLALKIHNYIKTLLKSSGVGIRGLDLNVFLGDYGWTPFGIHKDGDGENVFHFHLGPGVKTMYLWDEDTYKHIKNHEFDDKLKHANYVYEIAAGDIFFMPHGYYHIGYTPELSFAITCWICNTTKNVLRNRIIKDLFLVDLEYSDTSLFELNPFYKKCTDSNTIEEITNNHFRNVKESLYSQLPLATVIDLRVKEYMYALQSNLYYRKPMFDHLNKSIKPLSLHKEVVIDNTFLIEYFKDKQSGYLFAFQRGHRFAFKYNYLIEEIIETLNTGKSIKLSDYVNKEQKIAFQFINTLFLKGGINVT